jgi:hypothetical protein
MVVNLFLKLSLNRILYLKRLAFCESRVKSIRIPSNVENIGEDCFYGCISLSEVVFESDSGLKGIDDFVIYQV